MNTESQTDRITQLEIELAEEKRIVDRVWNALGISTYDQAKPLAIDEHVKSLLDRLQAAESRLAEWEILRTNDAATHQNILRGIIALTRPQALHLAGAQDYDELKDRLQAAEAERDELRFKLKTYVMFRLRCDKCGDLFNEHHQGEACPGTLYKRCTGTLRFNLPVEALLNEVSDLLGEFAAFGNCDCDIPNGKTCEVCQAAMLQTRIKEALQPAQKDAPEKGTK